jgi:hypothetical protein
MEVSLRPGGAGLGSLRPGGGGLLSTFAAGSRPKHTASASKEEKGYDEVIKYDRAFLLAFKEVRSAGRGGRRMRGAVFSSCQVVGLFAEHPACLCAAAAQRCTSVPSELEHSGSEVLLGSSDNEFVPAEERCAAPSLTKTHVDRQLC